VIELSSLSIALIIIGLSFEAVSFFIAINKNLFLSKEYKSYLESEKVKEIKGERIKSDIIETINPKSIKKKVREARIVVTFFVLGCFLQGIALFF